MKKTGRVGRGRRLADKEERGQEEERDEDRHKVLRGQEEERVKKTGRGEG